MRHPDRISGVDTDELDDLLTVRAADWTMRLGPLVDAARGPGESRELAAEDHVITAMARVIAQDRTGGPPPRPRHIGPTLGRVVAAKTTAVVVGLTLATAAAAAAAGVTASLVVPDPGGSTPQSPRPAATAPATSSGHADEPETTGCDGQCRSTTVEDPADPTTTAPPSSTTSPRHAGQPDQATSAPPPGTSDDTPASDSTPSTTTTTPTTTPTTVPPDPPSTPTSHGPPEGKGPPDTPGPPAEPGGPGGRATPAAGPVDE